MGSDWQPGTTIEMMEEVRFSAADGYSLVGTLTLPEQTPARVVVAVHGSSTGTRSALLHRHLSEYLPDHGTGVFVFDRRGEGASDGIEDAPLEVLARDVASAVETVADHHEVEPNRIGLWGHSQGGWIAPLAAAQIPLVHFMVLVAGSGVSPARQMRFAIRNLMTERGYPPVVVKRALSLRDRAVHRWSGISDATLSADLTEASNEPWYSLAHLPAPEELTDYAFEFDLDLRPTLRHLHIPALLIYGESDRWVPIEESLAIWKASYGSPEMLRVARIPGAGHLPTLPNDSHDLDEIGPISAVYEEALTTWLDAR